MTPPMVLPLTDDEIAEYREHLGGVMAGPWRDERVSGNRYEITSAKGYHIGTLWCNSSAQLRNVLFIARAPEIVASLLGEVDRLRAALAARPAAPEGAP